jgi:hypothetical protein
MADTIDSAVSVSNVVIVEKPTKAVTSSTSISLPPPDDAQRRVFLEEELDHRRSQIKSDLGEARALERYVVTVSGAAVAWISTHQSPTLPKAVYWVPFGIALMGGLRASWARRQVRQTAAYVRELEQALHPPGGGWETFLGDKKRWSVPATVFWPTLLLATGWLGWILSWGAG